MKPTHILALLAASCFTIAVAACSQPEKNDDAEACDDAIEAYGEVYDDFDRSCETDADCQRYDDLASCGTEGT